MAREDSRWCQAVEKVDVLATVKEVVNPNIVCPDENPREWELVDANVED